MRSLENITRELNSLVESGEAAKQKLIANINRDPNYALQWLGDTPEAFFLATFAGQTLSFIEENGFAEKTMELVLAEFRRQLGYWNPESSTSPWSNAVNDQKYRALKRYVEQLSYLTGGAR